MTTYTGKSANLLWNGVEIAELTDFEFSDGEEQNEAFPVGVPQRTVRVWQRLAPAITPDGAVGRAVLGVFAWRLLDELQAPLHRRASMARFWSLALQPTYQVGGEPGLPRVRVQGDQRRVIAAFEKIRRAAGDFDKDDVDVN